MSLREPTELDQFGLGRLQSKAELTQPTVLDILYKRGVRSKLEASKSGCQQIHEIRDDVLGRGLPLSACHNPAERMARQLEPATHGGCRRARPGRGDRCTVPYTPFAEVDFLHV